MSHLRSADVKTDRAKLLYLNCVFLVIVCFLASCCTPPTRTTIWQLSGKGKAVESLYLEAHANSVLFENADVSNQPGRERKLLVQGDLKKAEAGSNDIVLDLRGHAVLGDQARAELTVLLDCRPLLKTRLYPEAGEAERIGAWHQRVRIPASRMKSDNPRELAIRLSINQGEPTSATDIALTSLDIYWGPPLPEPGK